MKKRMVSLLLVLVMLLGLLPTAALAAPVGGGSGTAEDPYLIATAQELVDFRDEVNGSAKKSTSKLCAKLTANIDLSTLGDRDWTPIGKMTNTYSDYVAFGGVFDGDGHTISGLKIDNSAQYQALFGYVKGGTIQNLTVAGSVTTSSSSGYAAGIVAYGSPVTLENCTNLATVGASQKGYAAGIVASAGAGSTITGCTNEGKISGAGDYVGGILATGTGTTVISRCINSGEIISTGKPGSYNYSVGGIAGSLSSSTVELCGNTGTVTSTLKRTAGIVGSFGGTMTKCFNSGSITGIYASGGIVGSISAANASVTDCYNTGSILCNAPTAQYKDSNAKGVGGIVGNP